ncbi:MAG: hypothetical protein ACRC31_02795, partial [Cetobacterium sp.]
MENNFTNIPVPFTQIPNSLIDDPKIPSLSKALYMYLCRRQTGWNFYMKEICSHFYESERLVAKALKILVDTGWVERKRNKIQGRNSNWMYKISRFEKEIEQNNNDRIN